MYRNLLSIALLILGVLSLTAEELKQEEAAPKGRSIKLKIWEKGIAVESETEPPVSAYLWFYEWHLFDAVKMGDNTPGSSQWKWDLSPDGKTAEMKSEWLSLTARAGEDGADLLMKITNKSKHDWPEIAAMIPCFNPGPGEQRERIFTDRSHKCTYFLGNEGLELLKAREIHFNEDYLALIDGRKKEGEDGEFVFSGKWPSSGRHAKQGLLVRESSDGKWVMGIGWESFISAQGHNPWKCMHLSVKVGPLKRGETSEIRGKMYLFQGSKEDCLKRFQNDFAPESLQKESAAEDVKEEK